MANILTANSSNVTVDGENIAGTQSITYREIRQQQDIMALGTDERIGVAYGSVRVTGELVVTSSAAPLNDHMAQKSSFQIVVNLKKEFGTGDGNQTVTFNDCYVRDQVFGLSANGVANTTYHFTATSMSIQ